jgi:hypothetical protein
MCGRDVTIPNSTLSIADSIAENITGLSGTLRIPTSVTSYSGANNFAGTSFDTAIINSSANFANGEFANCSNLQLLKLTAGTYIPYANDLLDNTPLIRGEGTVYVSSLCAQQYINN